MEVRDGSVGALVREARVALDNGPHSSPYTSTPKQVLGTCVRLTGVPLGKKNSRDLALLTRRQETEQLSLRSQLHPSGSSGASFPKRGKNRPKYYYYYFHFKTLF